MHLERLINVRTIHASDVRDPILSTKDKHNMTQPSEPESKIRRLDETVIQRIAAGEIIVSPVNALKELLENSIDSGATKIEVVVKEGGFKLLQVSDNGSGIAETDLPILCERHTTSKIKTFTDLATVGTLGFRGEALASISHIAHLMVVTKIPEAQLATKASYLDSKLLQTQHQAGLAGTQVIVEDLFFNSPSRLQALRHKKRDEYQKILDVVTRYSLIHQATFSCKQHGEPQAYVVAGKTIEERIRKIFGSSVANELLKIDIPSYPALGLEGVTGFVTSLNYQPIKGSTYVFFVNNRLVSSRSIQRGLQKLYTTHNPKGSAFVFLSIKIASPNVDVNMHPTKQEVKFLYEDEITDFVSDYVTKALMATEVDSRKYQTQSVLSSINLTSLETPGRTHTRLTSQSRSSGAPSGGSSGILLTSMLKRAASAPRQEYKLVRTDPTQATLTSLSQNVRSPKRRDRVIKSLVEPDGSVGTVGSTSSDHSFANLLEGVAYSEIDTSTLRSEPTEPLPIPLEEREIREYRPVDLASVSQLRQTVKDELFPPLFQLFAQHTVVGIVDSKKSLVAVQKDVHMYLVDFRKVAKHLFYQIVLADFGNFGTIHLGDGLPIEDLLALRDSSGDSDSEVESFVDIASKLEQLVSFGTMLDDYFGIKVETKQVPVITQLPLLLEGHTPTLAHLPEFLGMLINANWRQEKECLDAISQAIAYLYAPIDLGSREMATLSLNFKRRLLPSKQLTSSVIEIASLPGLYKVFERC